jgi:hypothetical protein
MEEKLENEKEEPALLSVNGSTFLQQACTNEYVLYQAQEPQMFGRIRVDLFLEYVPSARARKLLGKKELLPCTSECAVSHFLSPNRLRVYALATPPSRLSRETGWMFPI